MARELLVKHVYPPLDDQVRIKLTKNSKGYGFEISVAGKDGDDALAKLWDVEQQLRQEYDGLDPGSAEKKPVGAGTPNGQRTVTSQTEA